MARRIPGRCFMRSYHPSGVRGTTNSVDLTAVPSSVVGRYEILKDVLLQEKDKVLVDVTNWEFASDIYELDLKSYNSKRIYRGDDVHVGVVVPGLTRGRLVVPAVLAGVCIEGEHRAQEQVVAAARAPDLPVPGRPVAGADVDRVELGIEGQPVPGVAAAPQGSTTRGS